MPPKVLIVDDEPSIVISIEFLMTQQGYQVYTAADGVEALESIKKYKPDLVILDVMMPHMDGYEVSRQIRSHRAYTDTKILYLTARGTNDDKLKGYAKGADDYIVKPFANDELKEKVRYLLEID